MARSTALPVIDFSHLHAPGAGSDAFHVELRSAAPGMGFVHVTEP
ncbi:hypothetical protein ACFQ9Z_16205 [Streptomyces sp. NPDC056580]